MAKCLLRRGGLVLLKTSACCGLPIFLKANHQLESRVPEIGLLGSEGGATSSVVPTPINHTHRRASVPCASTRKRKYWYPLSLRHSRIRSTSLNVISSFVRSYSLVVRGDSCPAICWACSSRPSFSR